MIVATLVLWATIVTGVVVLGFWSEPSMITARSKALGASHASIGLVAVGLWTIFLIVRSDALGMAALAALVIAPAVGIAALVSTRSDRRGRPAADEPSTVVPAAVLIVHACAAVAALSTATAAYLTAT